MDIESITITEDLCVMEFQISPKKNNQQLMVDCPNQNLVDILSDKDSGNGKIVKATDPDMISISKENANLIDEPMIS